MTIACLISAREYYIGYKLQAQLEKEVEIASSLNPEISDQSLETNSQTTTSPISFSQAKFNSEKQQMLQVGKGDTIGSLLANLGIAPKEIEESTKTLRQAYNFKDLQIGQIILVKYHQESEMSQATLVELEFKPDIEHQIILTKHKKHGFKVDKFAAILTKKLRRIGGNIKSSFHSTAHKLHVPKKVINEAIKALSYTVNFQHGIRRGDPFELLYEEFQDSNGKAIKSGSLLYIAVSANGHPHKLYHFKGASGVSGYYNAKGESVVRALLQTPIDPRKMRITSGYGPRTHPIKGYRRDHKGIDFGAPIGTAVMSAGDGVVIKAGYHGDFGNYVRIRHASTYETEYGHLSKIFVRVGTHVSQGHHIGNVGATGLATGPHLHFGVLYKSHHVNPMTIKQLPTTQLAKNDLTKFNLLKTEVETQIVGFPLKNQLVAKDVKEKSLTEPHHHSHHHRRHSHAAG